MKSISHWGMFEIEDTPTVQLWQAVEEYARYDANYLHGGYAEQPRAFHQRLGCGDLD